MTTPSGEEQTQPTQQMPGGGRGAGGYGGYGRPGTDFDVGRLPMPGNAEFLYLAGAAILLALIAGISDAFDTRGWVTSFTALSVAYLLSRGIAKASRVFEH